VNALKTGMKNDGSVKLHGFMNLSTSVVDAHIGRNPSTGEDIKIPKKIRAKAKFSNSFKDFLNA
jgi:nucleoid DNA-binding protein